MGTDEVSAGGVVDSVESPKNDETADDVTDNSEISTSSDMAASSDPAIGKDGAAVGNVGVGDADVDDAGVDDAGVDGPAGETSGTPAQPTVVPPAQPTEPAGEPAVGPATEPVREPRDVPGDPDAVPGGASAESAPGADAWRRSGAWQVDAGAWVPPQQGGDQFDAAPVPAGAQPDHPRYPEIHQGELEDPDDDEWADEYHDGALFTAIFSAPSLALAAFVFAITGLLGGMIPESLPYLVQIDPASGPAHLIRIVGLIDMGFAIVAASLGLAAMLRAVGSPLRWPTYLGGAAVLLALLIALQSVLLILLAGAAPEPGGSN